MPDRHDDGTNVIALPAALGFRFAYGPGSFRHHVAEAHDARYGCAGVAGTAASVSTSTSRSTSTSPP